MKCGKTSNKGETKRTNASSGGKGVLHLRSTATTCKNTVNLVGNATRLCHVCEIQSENCESVVLWRDRRGRTGSVINLPADSSRAEIDGGPSHRPAATLRAAVTLWAVTFMQPAWRTETGSEHQTPNTLRQCGSSGGGSSPWVPVHRVCLLDSRLCWL